MVESALAPRAGVERAPVFEFDFYADPHVLRDVDDGYLIGAAAVTATVLSNAAKARFRGIEADVQARTRDEQMKSLRVGTRSYSKLIDLIEAGDVDAALHHWRLHLQNANATWASKEQAGRIVDALSG